MSKNYRIKILSNFFALSIVQGTNFLIPLLVMPFVIGRIGINWFGVIAVTQVVMVYLTTIADYGFNLTATRDVALCVRENNTEKISRIFFTVLTTKLIITIFLFVVLFVVVEFVPFFKAISSFYLFGFAYVFGQSLLVNWFFQGIEKMKFVTYSVLLARVAFVIMVILFIKTSKDSYLFLFFFGLGSVLAGLFSIYIAIRIFNLKLLFPVWSDIADELKNGWQIMISNVFINAYLYSNTFVLRFFANDLVVGYYSIAERIFFAVRQILGVFSQAIYPQICQLVKQNKSETAIFFKKIYMPFLLLVSMGSCVVFIFSPQITQIFTGNGSNLPGLLLRILSVVPIIVCLNIPANLLLLSFNKKKSYLRVSFLGTIINIFANVLLANVWGATGTVVVIIITEVFIMIGLNVELYRNNLFGYARLKTP